MLLPESSLITPPVAHTPAPHLYDSQLEGVNRFIESDPRRLILAWSTGCGKTAASLTALSLLAPAKALIVCPALVRRHWHQEFKRWAPHLHRDAAVIEYGRTRQLSNSKSHTRKLAYEARCQIISYDLVHDVDAEGWDLLILDEIHHIANPLSQQSKMIQSLVTANPRAAILGLSATLIPTEAEQLWNPLRLLFPKNGWGRPYRNGGVSWQFKSKYCELEKTAYGVRAHGVRESMRKELQEKLLSHCHVLAREDIAKDLPPLDLRCLSLDQPPTARSGRYTIPDRLAAWAEESRDLNHLCILTRHRYPARACYDKIKTESVGLRDHQMFYLDGSFDTARRDLILRAAESCPKSVLVGTHEALSEGIRLMWVDAAIIDEWSQSPGRMVQLLGRFNSLGSTRKPAVNLVADADNYGAAQTLIYRLNVVSDVMKGGASLTQLKEALQSQSMDDEQLKQSWLDMFSTSNLDEDREDWSDADG